MVYGSAEWYFKTPLAPDQTFSDDPLRMQMMRLSGLQKLNFIIEPETFQSISRNAKRIKIVSGERIADELNKIVLSKNHLLVLKLLYKSGLLEIIFPQMTALSGAGVYRRHGAQG